MEIFECLTVEALFREADSSLALPYLRAFLYPWEALAGLADFVSSLGRSLPPDLYEERAAGVFVAKSAKIHPSATLIGPAVICEGAELRTGAFLRGGVLVGRGATVGNASELKNCILFDMAAAPHYNYVGDSVLGYRAHLGAGAVTSNLRADRREVGVRIGESVRLPTGRRKCGAFLGDFAEIGCHAVLNPGSVIAPHATVYPLTSVRRYVPAEKPPTCG